MRLGLVKVDYGRTIVAEDYSLDKTVQKLFFQRNKVTAKGTVTFRKGSMRRTAWGEQFPKR